MRTITAVALIITAVLLTSAVCFSVQNPAPFSNPNTTPNATITATATPTANPTVEATPYPTVSPTPEVKVTVADPSIPEFTVEFVNRSYDEPAVYKFDPYTNETVLVRSAQHIENLTIDVTIRNQPFNPITLPNGTIVDLFFNVRSKGYYEEWPEEKDNNNIAQANSGYTVVTYVIGEGTGWGELDIRPGGQVDFQIKAQIGYYYKQYYMGPWGYWTFFERLAQSGWSSTQTVTIPK